MNNNPQLKQRITNILGKERVDQLLKPFSPNFTTGLDNGGQNQTQQNNEPKISSSEAQNIASSYIEEPSATAGTPRLIDDGGQKIYIVPVILNGSTVGQIEIDAYTGKNVGGAGGAS